MFIILALCFVAFANAELVCKQTCSQTCEESCQCKEPEIPVYTETYNEKWWEAKRKEVEETRQPPAPAMMVPLLFDKKTVCTVSATAYVRVDDFKNGSSASNYTIFIMTADKKISELPFYLSSTSGKLVMPVLDCVINKYHYKGSEVVAAGSIQRFARG